MSRAFVKEDDGAPPPPPLERPISAAPNLVTARGARLIDEAIASLEAEIAATADEEAAAPLRRDLRYWQSRRATAQLTASEEEGAGFATRVTIRRGGKKLTIAIVGEDEADPAEGRIAINTMADAVGIRLPSTAPLLHFAKRQDMVAWGLEKCE